MGLAQRFNLVLAIVFLVGLAGSGLVSRDLLQRNARDEAVRNAEIMIEAALAVRGYTVDEVRPHLVDKLDEEFLPQTVPAYAATETLARLPDIYADFSYKEATLNPTNPRDRATDWEADIIGAFASDEDLTRLTGVRETPRGDSLFIAHPIRIASEACLACHSVASAAPASMIAKYGDANGFGWTLDEVVGAQIVSVPVSVPVRNANRAFLVFILSLCAIFAILFVALNIMLSRLVVRPISKMSLAADEISTGNFQIPEFGLKGKSEISRLATSFDRMRRSLEQAMKMIDS